MTGLPALLGALGLVGIGFALLDLVLAMFGAPMDLYWIGGNLTLGVVLLGAAAVLGADALRERLRSGEARRAGKFGASATLTTLLMIAILGGIGFLSVRYHKRFDWSEAQVHSLSDQSRKVLDGLEADVHALALYPKLDAGPAVELLERYAYQSPRFELEVVDPNERPDVLQRHGIDPSELGNGLVRIAIGDESTLVKELTEENVTNAMVKLTRTGAKKVYFLQGHNERAIEGEGGEAKEGYGRAADALRNENYSVEPLLLAAAGDVPDDADVVVVAGATRPLLQQERDALNRYLERGGALLALVDPRARTDFVADLRQWGVDVGDDVIIDRRLALFGQAMTPIAQEYAPDHDITRDLRDATLFHVARSVRPVAENGDFTEIVFTSEHSWAERDLERWYAEGKAELGGDDVAGPVSVAVAGTPRLGHDGAAGGPDAAAAPEAGDAGETPESADDATRARLSVFGDADFASNELIEAYRNRDLFLNTVNWLLGDVEAIAIRPVRSRASRFALTQDDFTRIRSLSLFVLPQVIAVVGVLVWWSRRWAPGR
jgi:ABC-type uncharacterized transport system involved in gliding motility auxiliary subunit